MSSPQKKQLVNPHQHSDYSEDGAATVEQIVSRNIELGTNYVSLTEHGNINSSMELYSTCIKKKVKPILGIELYVRTPFKDWLKPRYYKHYAYMNDDNKITSYAERKLRDDYLHLTVHFKDEWAYQYFCKLTPKMERDAVTKFTRKPMCDLEDIKGAAGHITIGSGCIMGFVQRWLVADKNGGDTNPEIAEQCYKMIRDIAGPGNFIVEVFPHIIDRKWVAPKYEKGIRKEDGRIELHPRTLMIPDGDWQRVANEFMIKMAQKYGDPIVISLDAHFAKPEQKQIQDAKTGRGIEAFKQCNSFHILSTDEAAETLKKTLKVDDDTINEWVENSYKWASLFDNFRITTNIDRWVISETPSNFMANVKQKIDKYGRMKWNDSVMVTRLKKEIKILFNNSKINLFGYFNDVEDIANYCRQHNILINTRGCLVGDTMVRMSDGSLKALEHICVGDYVISHTGESRRVTGTHKYDINEPLLAVYTTKSSNTPDIMTADHEVFAYKRKRDFKLNLYTDGNMISEFNRLADWYHISQLEPGDLIFHPWVRNRKTIDLNVIDLASFAPVGSVINPDSIEYTTQPNEKNNLFSIKGLCKKIGIHPVYFRKVFIKNEQTPSNAYIDRVEELVLQHTGMTTKDWISNYRTKKTTKINRFINIDDEWVYLIGKWIGDGWTVSDVKRRYVGYAFHSGDTIEIERTKKVFQSIGCETYIRSSETKKISQLYINCPVVTALFRWWFPEYRSTSDSKYLSSFKYLPDERLKYLIRGIISADGHHRSDGTVCIDSTSKTLMNDVREVLLYLRVPNNVSERPAHKQGDYTCAASYKISFRHIFGTGDVSFLYDNGYFTTVREIKPINNIPCVYDIKVDIDSSYITQNFAVHNSAGGSLYLYLIGVNGINPLKHGLSFERFLTEGRILANTLPDVDMDTSNQDAIFDYLSGKHGDNFCRISTIVIFKIKSAIKDAERAIRGKVSKETEKLCKVLPTPAQGEDGRKLVFGHADKDGTRHPGLIDTNEALKKYIDQNEDVWALASEMMGVAEHQSVHACGVVIADKPVQEYCPVMMVGDTRVTGFPPKSIEIAGLVKYDLLQVNTLRDIQSCLKSIKERFGTDIDPWDLPNDKRCWDQFSEGRTETVFQFDTPTVRPYLVSIKPKDMEDLAAITALCRPGTLEAPYGDGRTLAQVFVDRRKGEAVEYIHNSMEPIMRGTAGIQLFQEQTMNIFKVLAGYDDERAETVRRGIGKKDEKVLESCMGDLMDSCLANGWTKGQVQLLIDQIMASARYSFNKSHAMSYAYVAYACMWLKINYPLDWWKATLSNAEPSEIPVKFWRYVKNFTSAPNVNKSGSNYEIVGNQLIAPFDIIRGVGDKAYKQLVNGAPYTDLEHFVKYNLLKREKGEDRSSVNTGTIYSLILAGALDDFFDPGDDLETKLFKFEQMKSQVRDEKQKPILPNFCGITDLDRYMFKKKVLSIYSNDLRDLILPKIKGCIKHGNNWYFGGDTISNWEDVDAAKQLTTIGCAAETTLYCCAYVVHERPFKYKNNTKQALEFTVDIGGYYVNEVMWPEKDKDIAPFGFKDNIVMLTYRVQRDRISIKNIVPMLSASQLSKYSVV